MSKIDDAFILGDDWERGYGDLESTIIEKMENMGIELFIPPSSGHGNDWMLVIKFLEENIMGLQNT